VGFLKLCNPRNYIQAAPGHVTACKALHVCLPKVLGKKQVCQQADHAIADPATGHLGAMQCGGSGSPRGGTFSSVSTGQRARVLFWRRALGQGCFTR